MSAATFDMPTDRQLLDHADLVVVATVLDSKAREAEGRDIYTDSRLQVEEVLKGSLAGDTLTISELGGFANGHGVAVPGSPAYTPGERVVAFLRKQSDGTYVTAFMSLGRFRFAKQVNGREVLLRDGDGIEVDADHAFDPKPATEFVAALRSGHPEQMPKVVVKSDSVPDKVATNASASAYVVTSAAAAGGYPLRWKNCEANCTISFTINQVHPVVNTTNGLANALDAWTDDPNSFIKLQAGGIGNDTGRTNDVQNDIVFDWDGSNPHATCESAKGCGIVYYNGPPFTHTFDGSTFNDIESTDVLVHQSITNQSAFEAVLAHELGHGIGFRHSNAGTPSSSNAIMNSTTPTNSGATLRAWDKEALAEVYGNGLGCQSVAITGTSGSGSVASGGQKTVSVTATGDAPISYQWYEGTSPNTTVPIAGATSSSYQVTNITTTRSFWARVSNSCPSSADSPTITITVQQSNCTPVSIVAQPQSASIAPGGTTTLSVTAAGSGPFSYKWYQGAVGDTSTLVGNTQTFTTPPLTNTTSYWVMVSNTCGQTVNSVNSALATVTVSAVCVPVSITAQPTNVNVLLGQGATLNVTVAGTSPFTYQWYQGDAGNETQPIPGATSPSIAVGPFNTSGTAKFWAKITNTCGQTVNSVNSITVIVSIACPEAATPKIAAPAATHYTVPYDVSWTGELATTPTFELQEATNADFTANVKTFTVSGAKKKTVGPHNEVATDTRFFYRVRGINGCTLQPTPYSSTTSTIVTRPQAQNSTSFSVSVPEGAHQPFTQDYLVPGFGETATPGDTFSITIDVPWVTVFPPSGSLSAGGTTVQLTIDPTSLDIGTTTATIAVTRTQPSAITKGGSKVTSNGTSTATLPFSVSLVTPVSPTPRSGSAPPGTMIIPAVAHADGIGTRFQSDVRIVNTSDAEIEYEISFTPSGQNGALTGKQTTLKIGANDVTSFDDIVKAWYGSGVLGEFGVGTIEIRPLNGANPLATFASSRTYAIEQRGTYGQFIPAIGLDKFIGNIGSDSLAKISLQQVANSAAYRSNIGLVEGSGGGATVIAKLFDGNNNLLNTVSRSLQPFGHEQLAFSQLFGNLTVNDGRIEVQVSSENGKATAYASVIDNATSDPLLVFPEQALRSVAKHYVVPGVAELENGVASNFHSDMRIFNAGDSPVTITLNYYPQAGDATPRPQSVQRTIDPGKVTAINDVLPSLWSLARTGGAVTIDAQNDASLVVTARTYSRDENSGTYGQFIPGVTSANAIGAGERSLQVLQLEQSEQYRTNLGLVEVTGQSARVEITAYKPDSKISVVTATTLEPNQFIQFGRIFQSMGLPTVYGGRISVKVLEGNGRVAAYGSVVDNRTVDPTYVPAQ